MRLFNETHIDFLSNRKRYYFLSIALAVLGMIALFYKGIPLGIDFQGGTEMQVRFETQIDVGDIRTAMDKSGFAGMEIKSMGSESDYLLRTPLQG